MSYASTREAAAALLVDRASLRMPICGRSMVPSLVEPMVLQIGSHAAAGIGDVIVFRRDGMHVAHRIVAVAPGHYRTAGDAQPHITEDVPHGDVVGRVVAVWSDASPRARRVDGVPHRLRGVAFARFHALRRIARVSSAWLSDLALRLQPRRRLRVAQRIVDALAAAAAGDPDGLAAALAGDAASWQAAEGRHRCAAALAEAARRYGIAERLPADIAELLRRSRARGLAHTATLHEALDKTLAPLREAAIPFVLLKGAARAFGRTPEAALHRSDDIDVLVRGTDLDRAAATLRSAGWRYVQDAATVARFRQRHHHAASLVPPTRAYPVELHHALASPGSLSLETTWEALEPFLVPYEGAAKPVLHLDTVGTALHLAIHAVGLERLRDVALLADQLPRLSEAERRRLRALVRSETLDPIRLQAPLALAARIAGIPWRSEPAVDAYVRWALRREDLPAYLRTRCAAAEAFMAGGRIRRTAWRALVPLWSRGFQILLAPLRTAGLVLTNVAALTFAAALPERDAWGQTTSPFSRKS